MNSLEYKCRINELIANNKEIIATCKKEMRNLNEDETAQYDENIAELRKMRSELDELNHQLEERSEEMEAVQTEQKEEQKNKNTISRNMENTIKFSLTRALRGIVNGNVDEYTQAVNAEGRAELRKAGIQSSKADLVLPFEKRTIQVTGENGTHDAVIETDFMDIMDPLKSKNILADLGVNVMSGLVGDIQIPYGSAITSSWLGETAQKSAEDATFDYIKMQPKRLATVVEISLQQLAQDSIGVENYLRKQIAESIQDKLEATFFGNGAATDNQPMGIFAEDNGEPIVKNVGEVSTFAGICDAEAEIELANYYGQIKYAANPKAKSAFRALSYGGKTTRMVFENNEVDGTPLVSSTHLGNKKFIVGDWSTVVLGQWAPVTLTVDAITKADYGIVRLIVNTFYDWAFTRKEAFVQGTVA
jgi:HK97 family phage major capsid protein